MSDMPNRGRAAYSEKQRGDLMLSDLESMAKAGKWRVYTDMASPGIIKELLEHAEAGASTKYAARIVGMSPSVLADVLRKGKMHLAEEKKTWQGMFAARWFQIKSLAVLKRRRGLAAPAYLALVEGELQIEDGDIESLESAVAALLKEEGLDGHGRSPAGGTGERASGATG